MRKFWLWVPLGVFALLLALAASGLFSPQEKVVASRMIGKPVPQFALPPAVESHAGLDSTALATGQPRLLNVFASWCVPCIAEAPVLMRMAEMGVQIDAIAIRDAPEDVAVFLARHGDPYKRIGADVASQVQIAMGSSGVPETFVIDGKGIIRHQHVGDIRADEIPDILAQLEKAK